MRTLTVNEIEEVGGGPAPLVGAAARCAASEPCRNAVKGAGLVILFAIAAWFGYENN